MAAVLPLGRLAPLVDRAGREYGVTRAEIVGSRRFPANVRARWAVVWAARQRTGWGLSVIGQRLGGRDHSTALHSVLQAEKLRGTDRAFRQLTDELSAMLAPAGTPV